MSEKGPEELLKAIQLEGIADIKDVFLTVAQQMEKDGVSDHATIVESLMAAAVEASVATVGLSRTGAFLQEVGMKLSQHPDARPQ